MFKVHPATDLFPMMTDDELAELGEFHVLNANRNRIVETRVDAEELGCDLGVLKPWAVVR